MSEKTATTYKEAVELKILELTMRKLEAETQKLIAEEKKFRKEMWLDFIKAAAVFITAVAACTTIVEWIKK